jgi:2-aminoethylphosphonate-pyruvate transaminase
MKDRVAVRRGSRAAPEFVLLNPGPVNVSARVRRALLEPDICHREPECSALLDAVRGKLLRAFAPRGGYAAVLLTASGTAAVEAAVASAVPPGKRLLVVNNGVYGARMAEMARAHGIGVREIVSDWFAPAAADAVDRALRADPRIAVVGVVHHETTVGLINPVRAIGATVRRRGCTLLVDSVSGLGGDPLDLAASAVGLCVGTAGKCIQGFPGIAFVLVRDRELRRMRRRPARSVYLHLPRYVAADGSATVPFTPAVQVLRAFDAALTELLAETVAGRIARYRRAAAQLRAAFAALGLQVLVDAPWRSNSLTTMALPRGVSYARLHDALKRRGFVIYEGQGPLRGKIFRVANMGALTRRDFDRFLAALADVLVSSKARMPDSTFTAWRPSKL